MSDGDWGDLERAPAQGTSKWLLFCGGGCLLVVLLMIGGGFWIYGEVQDSIDSEQQWARLEEVLPYDERPEGWHMRFGWNIGVDFFVLADAPEEGEVTRSVTLLLGPEDLGEMFDPQEEGVGPWTPAGREESLETLAVQGRELAVVRLEGGSRKTFDFWGMGGGSKGEGEVATEENQPAVAIDLTWEGEAQKLVLVWSQRDLESLTVEEVRTFLAPFHVGPDR